MTAPFFPGIRPHFENILATDFSEYTLGAQPPDWTKAAQPADFTATVETVAGSISGKALKIIRGPQSRQTIVWDKVPPVAEVEVLIRQKRIELGDIGATFTGAFVRGVFPTTSGNDMTGYLATVLNDDDPAERIIRYVAGAGTAISQWNGINGSSDWFWTRVNFVGSILQIKHWIQGTPEPAAYNSFTDPSPVLAEGQTGMGNVNNVDVDVDYFAASLGAPGVPPTPIPLPL